MEDESRIVLPRRIKGKHYNSFRECTIESNYYSVGISTRIEEIYIYKVVFTPFIPHDNTKQRISLLQKALSEISAVIRNFVFI